MLKSIGGALLLLSLIVSRAAELATFSVQEPLGQSWTDEWILKEADLAPPTNGVLVSNLRVVNQKAEAVPAQFYYNRRVLNDALRLSRPIKVGVYFRLSLQTNQTAAFRITDEGKARNPSAQLHIVESGRKILITNGIYALEFDAATPRLINAMRSGSVKGTFGHFRWPAHVTPTNVTDKWVDRGPVRAMLRRDFVFENPAHHFHAHLEFRAGDPWVQVMDNYNFGSGSAMELGLGELNAKAIYHAKEDSTLAAAQAPIARLLPIWRDPRWKSGPFAFICNPAADHGLGIAAVQASAWNCRSDITMESQSIEIHGDHQKEGQVLVRFPTDGAHRSWALIFGPPDTRKDPSRLIRSHIDVPLDRVLTRWKLQWNSKAPEFKTDAASTYLSGHFNRDLLNPAVLPRKIKQQLDDALKLKHVKSRDLAALAYLFISPEYWPPPDDYAWKPAHPSSHTDMYNIPLKIGLLMPDHPDSAMWVNYGVRETYRNLLGDSFAGGAWAESPGYSSYVFDIAENISLLRAYGVTNGFQAWPRLKEVLAYLAAIHTSEDPRYGARQIVPLGDTSPGNLIEQLRNVSQFYRETDPGFADQLNKFGLDLGSREFKGFGAMLRGNPRNTRHESFAAIKAGPARSHYYGDELAFHFCSLGTPLVIDYASGGTPPSWSAAIHNRPDMNGKSPRAVAEPRLFRTAPEADVFVADERATNISHVPMEPHLCTTPLSEYPETNLDEAKAWKMRRYVMLVKHDGEKIPDYLVVRDEVISPEPVGWNLHALVRDISGEGPAFTLPGQLDVDLTVQFIALEALKIEKRQWGWGGSPDARAEAKGANYESNHFGKLIPENFQRGSWKPEDGERTQWLRAQADAGESRWFVLLVPNLKGQPAPKIDNLSGTSARISFEGESEIIHLGTDASPQAAVERGGKIVTLIAAGSLKPLGQTEFAPPERNLRKPRF